MFTLRQLAEKYEEFGKALFVCYIDFRKAFDSVWRKGLWKTMRHYGFPEKIVRILEDLYKDTYSAVRVDGELSDWFNTVVGFYKVVFMGVDLHQKVGDKIGKLQGVRKT